MGIRKIVDFVKWGFEIRKIVDFVKWGFEIRKIIDFVKWVYSAILTFTPALVFVIGGEEEIYGVAFL
jgi:hypothetical protein